MAFKTLLTIVHRVGDASGQVAIAADLARRLDAHLDILCLGIDEVQLGYYFAGAEAVVHQTTLTQARDRASEILAEAEAAAGSEGVRWSAQGVVSQVGALGEIVARVARFADLVVLPRPYGEGRDTGDEAVLESALFAAQTPVLVVPDARLPKAFVDHAVIGWNDGSEALRAVRAALPALQRADRSSIAIIDPPRRPDDMAEPGRSLSTMLDRHGVRAEVALLPRAHPRIADCLLDHVADTGASLLVTGAYGHSRFRQAILGGATRELLEKTTVPLLMAH